MPSRFKFVVTDWPTSWHKPGDEIRYEDFLNGVIAGAFPVGAKVIKVANDDYEFEVIDTGSGKMSLVSRAGTVYTAKENRANSTGVAMTRRTSGKKTSKTTFSDSS
jgi:hypothetical protein